MLFALLSATEGSIAPNATASVVIMDDEPYDPPVFAMAQDRVTLNAGEPRTELVIRRLSGDEYYSTVLVSTYSMTAQRETDFTPLDNEQVVFAPGEMEKTVPVEALTFSQSSEFGVRIKSDGSCEIGENDRTVVHIEGEKSANVPAQAGKAENGISLQALSVNASSAETFAAEDGVVGEPYDLVPGEEYTDMIHWIGDGKPLSYYGGAGEKLSVNKYLDYDYIRFTADLGRYLTPSSVTVKFTIASDAFSLRGYGSDDDKLKAYWGPYNSSDIYRQVEKREFKRGETYEITLARRESSKEVTIELPYRFCGGFTINEIRLNYGKEPVTLSQAGMIQTQPAIDLSQDEKVNQTVNYQPPQVSLQTDSGAAVTAAYPIHALVRIVNDEEDLMKHGVLLYTFLPNHTSDFLYNEKRLYVDHGQISNVSVVTTSREVNVHLQSTDNGDSYIYTKNDAYQKPFKAATGTILKASGYAASGKVITGYDIYAGKANDKGEITERRFLYTYQNVKDPAKLGGSTEAEWFHVPAIQEDGWTEVIITPRTEIQSLTVKPHPSTKHETIYEDVYDGSGTVTGQREVTYEGRAYLKQAFAGELEDNDVQFADKNGQIYFEHINSGTSYTFRSVAPLGYLTEWVNGTMDDDEDGEVSSEYVDNMTPEEADELYTPVYGNQFVYKVAQVQPKYYYRFTKFEPSRLMNGRTRVAYVRKDKRTILDYNGKAAQPKDYIPCSGATVQIGENSAVTDSTGRYSIPMDGVPDDARVSAVVTTDGGNFVTHVLSNVATPILIPCYDTFEPQKVTAAYRNEASISVPGIKVADKELTVTVKVKHSENSLYIKKAGFYITDSSGKKVVDCSARAEEANSSYKINYTHDETFGYAELKMNPGKDMLSGYKIYVYFVDQNGTEHCAMNTGYRFIEQLNLGTIMLGDIGSSSASDATTSEIELLGAPLFDMDLGQIGGFSTSTGLIEPDAQLLDTSGNKMYEYDATLYSYEWKPLGYENWTDIGRAKSRAAARENGVGDNGGSGGGVDIPKNAVLENGEYISKLKNGGNGSTENGLPTESGKNEPPKNGTPPKGSTMNNGKPSVQTKSEYNFELTPAIRFDLVTTARPTGEKKTAMMFISTILRNCPLESVCSLTLVQERKSASPLVFRS